MGVLTCSQVISDTVCQIALSAPLSLTVTNPDGTPFIAPDQQAIIIFGLALLFITWGMVLWRLVHV